MWLLFLACTDGADDKPGETADTEAAETDSGSDTAPLDADGDGYAAGEDCDDTNAAVNPGAVEVCDDADVDEDCDSLVDEADASAALTTWFRDADGDGWGDEAGLSVAACDAPAGYGPPGDCDDLDGAVHPDAPEVCDAADRDEDCSGAADDLDVGTDPVSWLDWHADGDGDGYGDPSRSVAQCDPPTGWVADGADCDDAAADVHPDAAEHCDERDEDCDGALDDDPVDAPTWYADADADGYGAASVVACDQPAGTSATGGDCDDASAGVHPGAPEHCDDVDEDCDGAVDEDAVDPATWYDDADGDGYGVTSTLACDPPAGSASLGGDCDDGAPEINPGAAEVCDAADVDEDCSGGADDAGAEPSGQADWYADDDGDGYGDAGDVLRACDAPAGRTADDADCDDDDATVHPGADERCDGTDDDCDGGVDEDAVDRVTVYVDLDGDAYGDDGTAMSACDAPGLSTTGGDCDDGAPEVNPGAAEVCDAADTDEDCSGAADDADGGADPAGESTWYEDADADGYGNVLRAAQHCDAPPGWLADASDCDDAAAGVHPGAPEHCDDVDEDCDGVVDNDAVDPATWYVDADLDGDGDPAATTLACDAPAGSVPTGTDCDDTDATVAPSATDACENGVDEDCSGLDAPCLEGLWNPEGTWSYYDLLPQIELREGGTDYAGRAVAAADLDGDGDVDFVGTDPSWSEGTETSKGRAMVMSGPLQPRSWWSTTYVIEGEDGADLFGTAAANVGDLTGDGLPDVMISAPLADTNNGRVYLYDQTILTASGSNAATRSAIAVLTGTGGNNFGWSITSAGDANADGYDDVLIGAYDYTDAGYAVLVFGPLAGSSTASASLGAMFTGTGEIGLGTETAAGVDVSGDGLPDLLLGAPADQPNWRGSGEAYLYFGPASGSYTWADADAVFSSDERENCGAGVALGDFDGDGEGDVALGCPDHGGGTGSAVRVRVWFGPIAAGDHPDGSEDLAFTGNEELLGGSLLTWPDIDADGADELVIGYHFESNTPGTFVHYGPLAPGTRDIEDDADVTVTDDGGRRYTLVDDIDGDGLSDVSLGSGYQYSTYTSNGTRAGFLTSRMAIADAGAADIDYGVSGYSGRPGYAATGAGDFDGDGTADLALGDPDWYASSVYPGGVMIFDGPARSNSAAGGDVVVTGNAHAELFGSALDGEGDVNGDAYADVLAGAPGTSASAGAAYVITGRSSESTLAASTLPVAWTAEATGDALGTTVAWLLDTDGDGVDEAALGAPGNDAGGADAGRVYLDRSPTGRTAVATADLLVTGEAGAALGTGLDGGDLTGDGVDDLVVGAPGVAEAYVFEVTTGSVTGEEADVLVVGGAADDELGAAVAVAGDLDADGYLDFAVGAPGAGEGGQVWFYAGPLAGTLGADDAELVYDDGDGNLGAVVVALGDTNGDGYDDVGMSNEDWYGGVNTQAGAALVAFGPFDWLAYPFRWVPEVESTGYNQPLRVGPAGDATDDGYADFVIGGWSPMEQVRLIAGSSTRGP